MRARSVSLATWCARRTTTSTGPGAPSLTFKWRDNGGTANGGVDTDQSANTFSFDITSVNDAPQGTSNTVTTNEDTTYTFTSTDFGFSDSNDTPENGFIFV